MKKFISVLCLMLSTSVASAQEKFTYYMMSTSNSPMIKITEPLVTKLRETYEIDWKQNVGCSVKTQVDKETKPIFVELVTGQYWMSLYEGNNNCTIDLTKIRWVMFTDTAYKLCVKADSPVNNWQDLAATKEAKIAYTTGTVGKPLLESLNKDLGTTYKPVLLTNSNAALTALLAKDIDAALLNVLAADPQLSQGNIKCVATTERDKPTSLRKISPKSNPLLTEFQLGYALGVKNITDEQFNKISSEVKNVLPTVKMPENVAVYSLRTMSEKDLRNKVDDATVNLYAATK